MSTIDANLAHRIALVFLMIAAWGVAFSETISAQSLQRQQLELKSPFAGTPEAIDGDSSGRFLVTSGSSRTLTVWSRQSETQWQPKVIYAPQRDEFVAARYLGAISPDASYIAFAVPPLSDGRGGYKTGTAQIYMLEQPSQHMTTLFRAGIPTWITRLKFSDDGKQLSAMLADGCGVRIWTREQWTKPDQSQQPAWGDDTGYAGDGVSKCCTGPDSSGCEQLPSGRDVIITGRSNNGAVALLTLSENGLRTYAKAGQGFRLTGYTPLDLSRPFRMAASPDGRKIAVGDRGTPRVAILESKGSGYTLSHISKIPETALNDVGQKNADNGNMLLPNPVWVQRGDRLLLYVFGYIPSINFVDGQQSLSNRIAIFDPQSEAVSFVTLGNDTDTSLYAFQLPGNQGRSIFFVSTHSLSLLDANAEPPQSSPRIIAERAALDFRGNDQEYWRLMLNSANKRMYLTSDSGDQSYVALEFDVAAMQIAALRTHHSLQDLRDDIDGHGAAQGYYDADATPELWRFRQPIGKEPVPSFFGKSISLDNLDRTETSYSGAKAPGRDVVVWGTDRALRVINGPGKIACTRPINSTAWRINITADGNLVVVAHGDGAIRWYRLDDGASCLPLVASLYLTKSAEGRWGFLAWLPNGKFMTDGGAATANIACYPTATQENFVQCVDFQQTDALFSPPDVIGALSSAESTEKSPPSGIVAERQQQRRASVVIRSDHAQASSAALPATIAITGWTEAAKYLTLTAGAGVDLPFNRGGQTYSAKRPLELSASGTLDIVVNFPESVQHPNKQIAICPSVYASLLPAGAADPASLQTRGVCPQITWKGRESGRVVKRKLWALLIGFSESSSSAGIPPLKYAHEDAINFARFLQKDLAGEVPGGKSYYDDIEIRLLVAPPEPDKDFPSNDPKVKLLQQELGKARLHVIYRHDSKYDDLVRASLKEIASGIRSRPNSSDDGSDWEDVILVYFSGHGFSQYDDTGPVPYEKMGLITPDADPNLTQGVVWLDEDLINKLATNGKLSLIIIDACRSEIGVEGVSAERAKLKAYQSVNLIGGSELFFLLASKVGQYSYELPDYGLGDFVPNFDLWPADLGGKGGGAFSLGLLTSLICGEAAAHAGNLEASKYFLIDRFFGESDAKWTQMVPKLTDLMKQYGLSFVQPNPDYFDVGGASEDAPLRLDSQAGPKCVFSASSK